MSDKPYGKETNGILKKICLSMREIVHARFLCCSVRSSCWGGQTERSVWHIFWPNRKLETGQDLLRVYTYWFVLSHDWTIVQENATTKPPVTQSNCCPDIQSHSLISASLACRVLREILCLI